MLYIVATPIGNLKDISMRADWGFKSVWFYNCGESELLKRLLQYIDALPVIARRSAGRRRSNPFQKIASPLEDSGLAMTRKEIVQFAEFNEQQVVKDITRRLMKNDGCLITDAGTPGISDPGFRLVRECVKITFKWCLSQEPTPPLLPCLLRVCQRITFIFGFPAKTATKP